jgi:hypothetical protein
VAALLTESGAAVKVLVCGSREVPDLMAAWDIWEDRLRRLPHSYPAHTVISGGARGADTVAHMVAKKLGYRTKTFRADWNEHGKKAGIVRNLAMLDEEPDLVIAMWDGESRGTKHTITEARKRGIPVEMIVA